MKIKAVSRDGDYLIIKQFENCDAFYTRGSKEFPFCIDYCKSNPRCCGQDNALCDGNGNKKVEVKEGKTYEFQYYERIPLKNGVRLKPKTIKGKVLKIKKFDRCGGILGSKDILTDKEKGLVWRICPEEDEDYLLVKVEVIK